MSASPTQRTLKLYRDKGLMIGVTEHWNPYAGKNGIRQDLFGFIDLILVGPNGTAAIQATSTGNIGARVTKILALPSAKYWLSGKAKRSIIVIGWKKYKKPVNRKWWRYTIVVLRLEDFNGTT